MTVIVDFNSRDSAGRVPGVLNEGCSAREGETVVMVDPDADVRCLARIKKLNGL